MPLNRPFSRSADALAVGAYGKLPAERDFVRARAAAFCNAGGDQWFEEVLAAVRQEKSPLPEDPLCFVLTLGEATFAGALAPSQDGVGRSFPLIVFAPLSAPDLEEAGSVIPVALQMWFDEARALLAERMTLSAAELNQRVAALAPPDLAAVPAGMAQRILEQEPADELWSALGEPLGDGAYAFRTLAEACQQAKKTLGPGKTAPVIVDAPVRSEASLVLWLDVAYRGFAGADAPLSFFWTPPPDGRLLISLGPPPALLGAFLVNPRHTSSRLWPLRTRVADALASARAALSPGERRALEAGGNLWELGRAFSGGRR
jgi:type VI secretion system protein ImpM